MKTFCIFLVVLLAVWDMSVVQAGQCMPPQLTGEYIENTDLIFEGHVSGSSRPSTAEGSIERFTITKLWKGDVEGDVTIRQNYYHAMGFHSGKKYLVFADKYSDDTYSTSGCSANVEIGDETPHELSLLKGLLGPNKEKEKE